MDKDLLLLSTERSSNHDMIVQQIISLVQTWPKQTA